MSYTAKTAKKERQSQLERNKKKYVFPARLELATFRVLGGRDNHYTTESRGKTGEFLRLIYIITLDFEKCVKKFRCFYISNSLLTTAYINCR